MKLKILLCLALGLLSIGCYRQQDSAGQIQGQTQTQQVDLTPELISGTAVKFPQNPVSLPAAINVSNLPKDVELSQRIAETIEKSAFKNARWGVFVTSLKDGRVLVAEDAQKLFNPASTQKVFTTAVALDRLGADFRWKTSVLAEKEIAPDGSLSGDLILMGRGAPDFDERGMASLVAQLKQKGLRRVKGNVVGDASFFHADNLGSGWVWDEAQWYYGAEPSALSYSDNTVLVEVAPSEKNGEAASIKTTPSADFVHISNNTKTQENATVQTVGVHRDLDSNNLEVWGAVPRGKTFAVRTTMHAPQLWAANALKKLLEQNKIVVEGSASGVDWRTSKLEIEKTRELASVESDPLAEIVKRTNKRSLNLNAELMLRTMGEKGRETADKEKPIMLGDDALGAMTIKNWLAVKGVNVGEQEIRDGSGLSRLDFVSPETMGRLLVFAAQMKFAQQFKDSLPIAGTDGTMGGRLVKFKDKVFAKTGTVTFVNALAGYAQISEDETLAFVILCNNETSQQSSVPAIDSVASLIAGFPDFEAAQKIDLTTRR
ncbi:MAG: D-alanyl-D-alanine carboxypeptidase/D-alanyl-D-alanine-endopeptidase [Pyrinomonadaceae bacterium]